MPKIYEALQDAAKTSNETVAKTTAAYVEKQSKKTLKNSPKEKYKQNVL